MLNLLANSRICNITNFQEEKILEESQMSLWSISGGITVGILGRALGGIAEEYFG